MSDSSQVPWSNNPNAPQIPSLVYLEEKANFAGVLIGAIFYGIVVVLFFQCMCALLNHPNRGNGDTKWGLVIHTTAVFSFATIFTAITLHIQCNSYIDNREFPGVDGLLPPGPLGYQFLTYSKAINVVRTVTFILNNWLADGLLLYRCYVIYCMSYWTIAFPGMMYLASLATGTTYIYQISRPISVVGISAAINKYGIPHHSISVSLNVLLTTMITIRLMMHSRDIRSIMGASATAGKVYRAVVTTIVESCALYSVAFLLFVGPWAAGNPASYIFFPIVVQTQAIAPFLVILRAANQKDLTREDTFARDTVSIRFRDQENSIGGSGTLTDAYPMSSMGTRVKTPDELGAGAEIAIDPRHGN